MGYAATWNIGVVGAAYYNYQDQGPYCQSILNQIRIVIGPQQILVRYKGKGDVLKDYQYVRNDYIATRLSRLSLALYEVCACQPTVLSTNQGSWTKHNTNKYLNTLCY